MTVRISLTQFIHFKASISTSARISVVKNIKENDYSPAVDYWLDLRKEINKFSEGKINIEELNNVVDSVPLKKKANYRKAINRFANFIKKIMFPFFQLTNPFGLMKI